MNNDNSATLVAVTGASGFIGLHCVLALLKEGYRVRGTLRDLAREASLRAALEKHVEIGDRLEFCTAELTSDDGWVEALQDCTYVLHVASPIPREVPKHEDDLIIPARDGALRVLRAAGEAGVSRVVQTSSIAAITNGHDHGDSYIYSEKDWTNLDVALPPYPKSKTIAERAAWEYMENLGDGNALELVVINSGMVYGPILEADYGTSGEVVRKLMRRDMPGVPKLGFASVDVRDVASAHIKAMEVPAAAGQRFCCISEGAWLSDIAQILNKNFAARGYKVPTRILPNFLVRLVALFDQPVRLILYELGRMPKVDNSRIKLVLDWQPRGIEEMVVAMADSMIEHKVV
ncbi:MAG: aldehyde reductase [Rhodospirillaceae bacterium]|nr:aldehyde reductase [Rhodospirillaceae bacterium]